MLRALYILGDEARERIYGPEERAQIAGLVDVCAAMQTRASIAAVPELLADVELIFSGWGGPRLDADFLALTPKLQVVFYGAGSVRSIVTDAFWHSGAQIISAASANAAFTGDFAYAQILLSLKRAWHFALTMRDSAARAQKHRRAPGLYGSVVGLVSLGKVAQRVASLLQRHELRVIVWDPYVTPDAAAQYGVTRVDSLEQLFREANVVSLHTPLLDETRGLIRGEHLRAMQPGATFINTSRGAIVREDELVAALRDRPDLFALLDVTSPEPPLPDSPLYTLPNLLLTPHIAGALGQECRSLGRSMLAELRRYLRGEPLQHAITRGDFERMA